MATATKYDDATALITARREQAQFFRADAYDRHKHSTKVCLHNGDLPMAIWHTKVALYMHRINRFA